VLSGDRSSCGNFAVVTIWSALCYPLAAAAMRRDTGPHGVSRTLEREATEEILSAYDARSSGSRIRRIVSRTAWTNHDIRDTAKTFRDGPRENSYPRTVAAGSEESIFLCSA